MEKNFNFKLISWFLVATFILANMPCSALSMDGVKSKARWMRSKAALAKEKTIGRLVNQYRATMELRRKKATGIATPAELAKLKRQMKRIKIAAAAIGITLATIAAIAGGVVGYKWYEKKQQQARAEEVVEIHRRTEMAEGLEELSKEEEEEEEEIFTLFLALQHSLITLDQEGYLETRFNTLAKKLRNKNLNKYQGQFQNLLQCAILPYQKNISYVKKILGFIKKPYTTALHDAMQDGDTKDKLAIIKLLITAGANVNSHDQKGATPLHIANKNNNQDMVNILIQAGANVNLKNKSGNTPLHSAASIPEKCEILEILLANGANVTIKNIWGQTALDLAKDPCNKSILAQHLMDNVLPYLIELPAEMVAKIGKFVGISKEDEPALIEKYWQTNFPKEEKKESSKK